MQTNIRFRLVALQIALALPLVWTVASSAMAFADDEPTIVKDSILVNAWTINKYKGSYDNWSWVPKMNFRVNGPIASGSQLYVEFTLPGKGSWVKFDCKTEAIEKDHWWKTECGGRDIPEDKGITSIGPFDFSIGMRNELAGNDSKLFTGKIKVVKAHTNEVGPKAANKWVYYIDEDWTLPIGYVFLTPSDAPQGWKYPKLNVAFWVRGQDALIEPHLFYKGNEVGKMFYQGEEVGKAGCNQDMQTETTQFVDEKVPQKAKWEREVCTFNNVIGWNKTGQGPGMFGPPYLLSSNPGDYEFKALWKGHLARSIKFTVGPEAKLDDSIATSNKLGNKRTIVPVQVLGDQDGSWNKTAWKTDAFYGNPLTGFTAAP